MERLVGKRFCISLFPLHNGRVALSLLGERGFKFTGQTFGKIVKRSVILLLIGVAINWFDMAIWGDGLSIWELRFWAVLQRIALCYFLVALFSLCGRPGLTLPLSVLLLVIYTVILVLGNGYSEVSSDNILYRVDESLLEMHICIISRRWTPKDY